MPNPRSIDSLKVVIIDDDEFLIDMLRLLLEHIGVAQVHTYLDPRDGLDALQSGLDQDILILDLNMPGMDGVQVLRELAKERFATPILLLSGEDIRILKTAQSMGTAYKLNVMGSLQKPVSHEILEETLQMVIDRLLDTPARAPLQMATSEEIAEAILKRQIVPFYQPKVTIDHRTADSAEILARWVHPERGLVPPIAFISMAEETGQIHEMTWLVFEQAVAQLATWRAQGHNLKLGMNLSAESLEMVELPERLAAIVHEVGVPCNAITFEITESRLMQNLGTALDILTRLRLLGFGLSIDDFGTGYSTMSQLSSIPFTELKIDRSFVTGAQDDPLARAILESSAMLGAKLNMSIVAEGVETEEDWNVVAEVGCHYVQGFLIAKPMSAEHFESWLTNQLPT